MKNKIILGLILAISAIMPLTGCSSKGWENDESNMGEVVVDENDTESLETPPKEEETETKKENTDISSKLNIVNNDNCSVTKESCTYDSAHRKVVFKGRVRVSSDYTGQILIKVTNGQGEEIGSGNLDFSGKENDNAGFSIEASLNDNSTLESVQGVEISFS